MRRGGERERGGRKGGVERDQGVFVLQLYTLTLFVTC